jgi:hypothetical protein
MHLQESSKGHYLDYYSEWVTALRNARHYFDMKKVCEAGTKFLGIVEELKDADLIKMQLASSYAIEVRTHTEEKFKTFLN